MSTTTTTPRPRPRTMGQITGQALRQAKQLGDENHYSSWIGGKEIGETLGDIVLRRRCEREGELDLAGVLEKVLGLAPAAHGVEERARRALFVGICEEVEKLLRWGYDRGGFRFNFTADGEGEVLRQAVQRAKAKAAEQRRQVALFAELVK